GAGPPGEPPEEPPGRSAAAKARAEARAQERMKQRLGRKVAFATGATKEAERGVKSTAELVQDTTARVRELQQAYLAQAAKSGTAQAFKDASREYYDSIRATIDKQIQDEAKKTLLPGDPETGLPAYAQESLLGLSSPGARDFALDDAWATFLTQKPILTPEEEPAARSFWHAMQVLNRFARYSIIWIPTVHAINNEGMHFLADGNDPTDIPLILAGKKTWSKDVKERAIAAGAVTERGPELFGGQMSTLPVKEQARMIGEQRGRVIGTGAAAGLRIKSVYSSWNHWLFGTVEQGYAFTMFDRYTKPISEGGLGMNDGEAAIRVRNALGRYDNVSPKEQAWKLNRLFFFYPWMKTVLNFWARKAITDPKWWVAPVAAIRSLNEAQGYDDPSRPFTMTIGKLGNGNWLRLNAPIPQRVVAVLAGLARFGPDLFRVPPETWMREDLEPAGQYLIGHLNPFASLLYAGVGLSTVGGDPTRVAPYSVFHKQSGQTTGQYLGSIAARTIPTFFSPMERLDTFSQDPVGTIAAFIAGGTSYSTKDPERKYADSVARHELDGWLAPSIASAKLYAALYGDSKPLDNLKSLRERIWDRIQQQRDHPQSYPPAPARPLLPSAAPSMQPQPSTPPAMPPQPAASATPDLFQ
ncbi:MAG: hypothetical protein WCB99_13620, partial [Candidatus Cybelea sp.]